METKILVIDDEEDLRALTAFVLKRFGYSNVLEADSGEAGIKMIGEHNPDLVITDLTMPGIRGEDVLRWVVLNHKPQHPIKLMAYSGDNQATAEPAARAAGADGYLSKPFLPNILKAAVEAVLAQP